MAAARTPTSASFGALGQAVTDHQLSSLRTCWKFVPETTTERPSLVLATI
jgi:uncharacterized protein HemY